MASSSDLEGGIFFESKLNWLFAPPIEAKLSSLRKSGVEFSWDLASPADKLGDAQKQVLDFVEQNESCTQSDIVSKLGKSKSQVSQIISKLCNEGFLCREDGRLFITTPY